MSNSNTNHKIMHISFINLPTVILRSNFFNIKYVNYNITNKRKQGVGKRFQPGIEPASLE